MSTKHEELFRDLQGFRERAASAISELRDEQRMVRRQAEQRVDDLEREIGSLSRLIQVAPTSSRRGRPSSDMAECGLVWQRLRDLLKTRGPLGAPAMDLAPAIGAHYTSVYQAVAAHPELFFKVKAGHFALRHVDANGNAEHEAEVVTGEPA